MQENLLYDGVVWYADDHNLPWLEILKKIIS